ncbi:MAG: hypothetical protein DSY76_03950 [Bacteroidetes bacterium]|nr:MAG: hypothetical protein DSY76_03950 [Bacteroidota bacterium]
MSYFSDKNKRTAIIATLLFHVLVILILIFTGLTPPMPPRPEIGVEVNLGNSAEGMGEKQTEKPVEEKATPPTPQKVTTEEKVVTQEEVKTVKVNDKVNNVKKTDPVVEPKEEPKTVDKRFIFNKNKKTVKGSSEGPDKKPGDKGKKGGDPNAKNYVGNHGNGISYQLKGRKGKSLPKPSIDYSEEGTVVVKIWVNKSGKVINAEVQEKGTLTPNTQLRSLAIKAAMASVFDAKPDAPEVQIGTIEYVFIIGG